MDAEIRVPEFLDPGITGIFPTSLTILPTYRCTAACEQCCFESSPKVEGRLSREVILARIREAHATFPSLHLVVFSGGEALMLKQDLVDAVALATELGLMTRIVSNGYWGKTTRSAERTASKLADAGLDELNFSTGLDHQRWVPFESVANGAAAAVAADIQTLITVENDAEDSHCLQAAIDHPTVRELSRHRRFGLRANSWMPFHESARERKPVEDRSELLEGCPQVFTNLVVTPHDMLSGCCGLTFEHIPEMKLGRLGSESMAAMYSRQLEDFLKAWIHVDGPYRIMQRLFGAEADEALANVSHICQACVILHQHPGVREAVRKRFHEFVPEVLGRLNLKVRLRSAEAEGLQAIAHRREAAHGGTHA